MKYLYLLLAGVLSFGVTGTEKAESYKGFYTWGHEVEVFKPCNSQNVYWLESSKEIYDELASFHQKVTTKPYQRVYVEVTGYEVNKELDGFAMNYNGYFKVIKVGKKSLNAPTNCK